MIIMTKYKSINITDVIVYDYISVLLSTLLFVDISECKYSEKSMEPGIVTGSPNYPKYS